MLMNEFSLEFRFSCQVRRNKPEENIAIRYLFEPERSPKASFDQWLKTSA